MVEWLSQELATRCGLLIPDCYVIELEAQPGHYMFGSRWEGGAEQFALDIIKKVTNPEEFSTIYAFDLLIHNVDRHLNNYLYLQLAGDTIVKAVDHSRCLWFSGWPMPPPPPHPSTNTLRGYSVWSQDAVWNKAIATVTVDKWRQIQKFDIQDVIDSLPQVWVEPGKRDELLGWWGSPDWDLRNKQVIGALP